MTMPNILWGFLIGILIGMTSVIVYAKYNIKGSLTIFISSILGILGLAGLIIGDMYAFYIGLILALLFVPELKSYKIKITRSILLIMLSIVFIMQLKIKLLTLSGLVSIIGITVGIIELVPLKNKIKTETR